MNENIQYLVIAFAALPVLLGVLGLGRIYAVWSRAKLKHAPIPFVRLIYMALRQVPIGTFADCYIAAKEGGATISLDELEAHYLCGGDMKEVVSGLLLAGNAGIELSAVWASALDLMLKGTDTSLVSLVRESVRRGDKAIEFPQAAAPPPTASSAPHRD